MQKYTGYLKIGNFENTLKMLSLIALRFLQFVLISGKNDATVLI